MNGQRSAWIAARARNAARQGRRIAATGTVSVALTLLALIFLPRASDRQLRARLEALPPTPDTLALVAQLARTRHAQDSLEANLALFDSVAPAMSPAMPPATAAQRDRALQDTTPQSPAIAKAIANLRAQIEQARTAPLPDHFRAVALSPLLRDVPLVRTLLDSIELLERERDAHAELGGADARYAALTAHLSSVGQRLVRLAEQRVNAPTAADSIAAPDSLLRLAVQTLVRQRVWLDSQLVVARRRAVAIAAARTALEHGVRITVPPLAMLIAALILGVASGFAIVLLRELRTPTVGDVSEVANLTGAAVIHHDVRAPVVSRPTSSRGPRVRPGLPPIIDPGSDAFVLLHLALTGVGDLVPDVDVLADDAELGAAVGLGIAAAAARESRAALVTESSRRRAVLPRLLRLTPRTRPTLAHTSASAQHDETHERLHERLHAITLEPDVQVDVLLAGDPPRGGDVRHDDPREVAPLASLVARHDLRLHLRTITGDGPPPSPDVILCVRQGRTPLAWLMRAIANAERQAQRVRAVVVWGRHLPTTG